MKKIVLLDPGVSSTNVGDEIISDSAKKQLNPILKNNFYTSVSTHLPMSYYYMRLLKDSDYNFVLGSNLLKSTTFGFKRQWDITLKSNMYMRDINLIGAGWWQYGNKPNLYTKLLYNSILNKENLHSVRDEHTEKILKSMGIKNVINTSCSTMWSLDYNHTKKIPLEKSKDVIFTITDYNKDYNKDKEFIKILLENYDSVYFWPQGTGDLDYIRNFIDEFKQIHIVSPNLESFDFLLDNKPMDYIGTRLHGGIRALQKGRRAMIIGIDNRAEEKKKSFNLPVISRDNIDLLEKEFINKSSKLDIKLPNKNIEVWKKQFLMEE